MRKAEAPEVDYLAVKNLREAKWVLWEETVKLWKIAGPVAFTTLFQNLANSSTAIYAGHLGDIELSSISLFSGVMGSIFFALLVTINLDFHVFFLLF